MHAGSFHLPQVSSAEVSSVTAGSGVRRGDLVWNLWRKASVDRVVRRLLGTCKEGAFMALQDSNPWMVKVAVISKVVVVVVVCCFL